MYIYIYKMEYKMDPNIKDLTKLKDELKNYGEKKKK